MLVDNYIINIKSPRETISNTRPLIPSLGDKWYNTDVYRWYTYNADINAWVSEEKLSLIYSKELGVDGSNLYIGTSRSNTTGYLIGNDAIIVSITGRADSGANPKSFDLKIDGVSLYSFTMIDYKYYKDTTLDNLTILQGKTITCFCVSSGSFIVNPIINIIIAWVIF